MKGAKICFITNDTSMMKLGKSLQHSYIEIKGNLCEVAKTSKKWFHHEFRIFANNARKEEKNGSVVLIKI